MHPYLVYFKKRVLKIGGDDLLLTCDKQLLRKFSGSMNPALEETLEKIKEKYGICNSNTYVFGNTLPLDAFLVTEEVAANLVFSNARKQWGRVDLFTLDCLKSLHVDTDSINDRLDDFFYSPKGKRAMMEHLQLHHQFKFANLISLLYSKETKELQCVTSLRKIYLYKVDNRYLVHPIFEENNNFWEWLFAKKVYSLFMQIPLERIGHVHELLIHLELAVKKSYPHVDNFPPDFFEAMDKCITYVDKQNGDSLEKKILFIQKLVSYFRMTNGQNNKLEYLANELLERWSTGNFSLTEKERVIIAYTQFVLAKEGQVPEKIHKFGRYLLEHERLNNHAVEIMLEYADVLPSIKPTPYILVKQYNGNYLEYIFSELIGALVAQEHYEEALVLIKEYEIASCETIHQFLNGECDKDDLYRIEATVQRDIAFIVDNSPNYISASIETWRANYYREDSQYYKIAEMTSRHVCHLMKIFFVTEQFDLFERLMETYKKYLSIEPHFEEMRQFMEQYV